MPAVGGSPPAGGSAHLEVRMQMPQGAALVAALIVAGAVFLLGGLTVAFKGSVQF